MMGCLYTVPKIQDHDLLTWTLLWLKMPGILSGKRGATFLHLAGKIALISLLVVPDDSTLQHSGEHTVYISSLFGVFVTTATVTLNHLYHVTQTHLFFSFVIHSKYLFLRQARLDVCSTSTCSAHLCLCVIVDVRQSLSLFQSSCSSPSVCFDEYRCLSPDCQKGLRCGVAVQNNSRICFLNVSFHAL